VSRVDLEAGCAWLRETSSTNGACKSACAGCLVRPRCRGALRIYNGGWMASRGQLQCWGLSAATAREIGYAIVMLSARDVSWLRVLPPAWMRRIEQD